MNPLFNLLHPYSRYGLAVVLLEERLSVGDLSAADAPEILARVIESGLSSFRMTTGDHPATAEVLRFNYLKMDELVRDPSLVQGALSAQGKYLAPAVVTTDGDAKGTWENAMKILSLLRDGKELDASLPLSRSFAPTTAKINNGKASQSPPKTSLFEAACSVITTHTEKKPAAWIEQRNAAIRNTAIIPDLPLAELKDFVELFSDLMRDELDGNLLEAVLPAKPAGNAIAQSRREKKAQAAAPKSEYRRPRLHNGNYPFAPRDAAYGPVGLLAAIGKWARRAGRVDYARRVLESIAGTTDQPGKPLYIISYDSVSQVQFTHHIVGLSLEGKLSEMIDALIRETTLYAEMDSNRPKWDLPGHRLFCLMTSRFLQQFTLPAFRDFLAARAEYAPAVQPLFEEYFMNARKIDRPLVESARALGQWLNRTAYFVADGEVDQNAADRRGKVQKAKAKILVEFESAAMSAKSPRDMLHRISTRAGRLLQQDIPAEATIYMDATNSEEIPHEDALHLLVAYLRLRATKGEAEPQASGTAA